MVCTQELRVSIWAYPEGVAVGHCNLYPSFPFHRRYSLEKNGAQIPHIPQLPHWNILGQKTEAAFGLGWMVQHEAAAQEAATVDYKWTLLLSHYNSRGVLAQTATISIY